MIATLGQRASIISKMSLRVFMARSERVKTSMPSLLSG